MMQFAIDAFTLLFIAFGLVVFALCCIGIVLTPIAMIAVAVFG